MLMLAAVRMHKHSGVICIVICGLLSPVKAFMATSAAGLFCGSCPTTSHGVVQVLAVEM